MKSDGIVRGRFAPSPSGSLHLGNLISSLLAWLDVRSRSGIMLFRLEDLDPDRSFDPFAEQMARDLEWLGLDWDEGWRPQSEHCRQSNRNTRYEMAQNALSEKGLVYDCYCSRAERLAASAPHPGEVWSGGCRCRFLSALEIHKRVESGRKPAKKLIVQKETLNWTDGHYGPQSDELLPGRDDFIIRRSDGVYAYQLAVSVDDMEMGVTRVVRARDLMGSTSRQIQLIQTLGGTPPEYCHAPLLVAPDSRKLSKRDGDLSMNWFRERYTPEALIGLMAHIVNLRPTADPVKAEELIADFSWDKVPKDDIILPNSFE